MAEWQAQLHNLTLGGITRHATEVQHARRFARAVQLHLYKREIRIMMRSVLWMQASHLESH